MDRQTSFLFILLTLLVLMTIGQLLNKEPSALRASSSETIVTIEEYDPPFEDPSGIDTLGCIVIWDKEDEDIDYPGWEDSLEVGS